MAWESESELELIEIQQNEFYGCEKCVDQKRPKVDVRWDEMKWNEKYWAFSFLFIHLAANCCTPANADATADRLWHDDMATSHWPYHHGIGAHR